MSNLINETFQKHLNLLHKKLNENVFEPENDTISARLDNWLDQNSSGYTSSFKVGTILNDLNIKKGTPAFNELVDAFKESGFELKGNEFVKIVKKGSGVSDEKVKDTANQYINHFGKGSSSLQMSAKDFVSMSQGGGDPDVRSNFPNWSDENFKQLLDILYTDGGLKRPVDETFQKHLNLLHKKLNENVFEPENDTISARLDNWLDQNSSGYTSSFEVDTVLNDLNIKKRTPAFNELVDAFKESGFELKGNEFVKIVKKGSGVSDKEVKDTANQYIKNFGKGSSSLQMSAKDFVSMSQGGGDPDVKSNFPNWSDENFKQLLDILYTDGGLKRPVDEVTNEGNEPDGLMGAVVIGVIRRAGKVQLQLNGSNSTQLYNAILV